MIDLHAHTTCSDGTDSPAALVARAAELGLAALAICDHDTLAAYDEALPAAAAAGLGLIVGVELSLAFEPGTFHLLGYHLDRGSPELTSRLNEAQQWRAERNERMLERLAALGLPLDRSRLEDISGGGELGRPHVARALVEVGAVESIQAAFDRYLAKDGPAYVPKARLSAQDGIAAIHAAGGAAVLAHPYQLRLDDAALEAHVAACRRVGLDGIEVFYSQHNAEQIARYTALAERYDLVMTAGSDYHGTIKPGIALGQVPGPRPSDQALLAALAAAAERWR